MRPLALTDLRHAPVAERKPSVSSLVASLLYAYPFAFCIDRDRRLCALGRFFQSRHPDLLNSRIGESFILSKPRIDVDLERYIETERYLAEPDTRTELAFMPPTFKGNLPGNTPLPPRSLRLVGAFVVCEFGEMSVFLGTIAPGEIGNMTAHGLTVGDFGPIDPSPEFAMMAEVNAGMLADSQIMNEQLRRSRDEALMAKQELEAHREHLEETVRERTETIERQAVELEEALKHEKQVSEMQRSFVSMASHEFRTPLAIIDGNAGRIERSAGNMAPDDIVARIRKIRRAGERMVSLVESTLTAAKLEAGTIQIEPRPVDIRTILRECCDLQQELAAGHRIELDVTDLPDEVIADPTSLTQIITNLLSNAVKYSPDADRIDVRGHRDRGSFLISVRDYGLGIDEDDQKRMFTRFFRARTSAGIPGTGIGLNLSKMLAQEHGGSIMVSSKKDEGSTFMLQLPLAATADERRSA